MPRDPRDRLTLATAVFGVIAAVFPIPEVWYMTKPITNGAAITKIQMYLAHARI